jgi:hypothetical protein
LHGFNPIGPNQAVGGPPGIGGGFKIQQSAQASFGNNKPNGNVSFNILTLISIGSQFNDISAGIRMLGQNYPQQHHHPSGQQQ